jgi:GNT-I family
MECGFLATKCGSQAQECNRLCPVSLYSVHLVLRFSSCFAVLVMLVSCFCLPDDLDISPDFFEYFLATYRVLRDDSTLWCVSAWNDNGKIDLVSNEPGKLSNQLLLQIILTVLTKVGQSFCLA